MPNFTNSIPATSQMNLKSTIIFENYLTSRSSCKNLFISKFPLETAAGKTSLERQSSYYNLGLIFEKNFSFHVK